MAFNIFFSIPAGLLMDAPVQAVLFLGIIPALIFLYFALKGYDGYYKDKTIFLTFILGIVLGIIVVTIRLVINPLPLLIIYMILFAFFDQLIKTIILNLGSFQRKKETTIYGLSLGLGFGSSFTPFLIIAGSISGQNSLTFLSLVTLGSLGFILFHAASGAYLGFGIYSGKMTRYLLTAIMLELPFNVLTDSSRFYSNRYFAYFQIGIVIFGAIFFCYVVKKVMPQIKEDTDKRKRSKKLDSNK